jgi:diacylglycerol kinase (ATP)
MPETLVILNPHAGGGKAGRIWSQISPIFDRHFEGWQLARTEQPRDVLPLLERTSTITRVIAIGGDGTNHAVINALMRLQENSPDRAQIVYGNLPVGTGRDWARERGIPFSPVAAVEWLATMQPRAFDVGHVLLDNDVSRYFLNIVSTGLGGEVDARVNAVHTPRPWTFLRATVSAIWNYNPQRVNIALDGEGWYDDRAYLAVVANGTTFGHGMRIAPEASTHDGLFDVVLVEAMPKRRLLAKLGHVYFGTHLKQVGVRFHRARQVEIRSENTPLALDLDGEYAQSHTLRLTVRPAALLMLA